MAEPPKMRLPYAPNGLRLVENSRPETSSSAALSGDQADAKLKFLPGMALPAAVWSDYWPIGPTRDELVSCYTLTSSSGQAQPAIEGDIAYAWDTQSGGNQSFSENEFTLRQATLKDLTIEPIAGGHFISITPSFTIGYNSCGFAAELAEVRLVESKRTILLDDGSLLDLLDTDPAEAPVLYLCNEQDASVLSRLGRGQSLGIEQDYCYEDRVGQALAKRANGEVVASYTLLERYTSFFMQRPLTTNGSDSIWVPAYFPISWGWSIRVEPEAGDWVITRRKLIMPVVGHEGLQLPRWQGNSIDYSASVEYTDSEL